ncbi:hypothetical protein FEM48_Zijuj05G0059300 [Ziziphus jujuba var. spinosa]|uniref:Uncharacterized protein n=1 Tax=Ziziphus jujuba var. spinosa TaxID=714518 RepID=A0A978VD72_ZIZJJ|nr:hypothetical protein FEM48_Zijuj05G0059300 [Ziziphus jujuba var. spinosa]
MELCKISTHEEVCRIIKTINPFKAPSPDGLPGFFFQHYEKEIEKQIVDFVQHFFREECMSKDINQRIFFSKSTSGKTKAAIKNLWNLKRLNKEVVYLGNPLFISRSKEQAFERLKEKRKNRVEHWQGRLLSQASRMALVREALSTVTVYAMSIFQLPLKLCKEMDSILRSFWWKGSNSSSNGWHLIAWDKICQPQHCGGLGLRRTIDFNLPLLAKLGWIMAPNEDRIWVKILKAKYCLLDSFLHCKTSKNCSYTWKGIMATREIIKQKACFMVGNGHSVDVWKDPWVPKLPGFIPSPRSRGIDDIPLMVDNLTSQDGLSWNADVVKEIFDEESAKDILDIHWTRLYFEDRLIWLASKKREF